jgi:hypothetical protein
LKAAGVRLKGTTPDLPRDVEEVEGEDVSDEAFEAEVAELRARGEL